MRYAIELPNMAVGGGIEALVEMARLAEEAGWDAVFLEDYIVHWSDKRAPTYDPWVVLAAMAMVTKRVRLGLTVTAPARRRPWKLAREAVTLDHLTGGRLILGVGLGDKNDPGFAQVGEVMDEKQRAGMLDEALDILAGLWSGEPFSYSGEHYQLRDLTFLPTPVQKPRIPIWVGGSWPHKGPVRRAARWDGILPFRDTHGGPWQDMTPNDLQALKAAIQEQRTAPASAPFDIVVGGRKRGPDWEQERALIKSLAEAGATWSGEYIEPASLVDVQGCIQHIKKGPLRID